MTSADLTNEDEPRARISGQHEVVHVVSSRGGKYGYVAPGQHDVYRALRREGKSKSAAARIANSRRTKTARSAQGRRAAATRRRRGRSRKKR